MKKPQKVLTMNTSIPHLVHQKGKTKPIQKNRIQVREEVPTDEAPKGEKKPKKLMPKAYPYMIGKVLNFWDAPRRLP